jgi:hypothetical protein
VTSVIPEDEITLSSPLSKDAVPGIPAPTVIVIVCFSVIVKGVSVDEFAPDVSEA